jgi:GWxTD domain-containing protein
MLKFMIVMSMIYLVIYLNKTRLTIHQGVWVVKKLIVLLLLSSSAYFAQTEYSGNSGQVINAVVFYVDASSHKSDTPQKTRVDFLIQVPYSSIQFTQKGDSFNGSFNITLSFMDEKQKNILFERDWSEFVKAKDFSTTLSRNSFNLSYKSYDVDPGKYFLKCYYEDGDSKRTAIREIPLNVQAINDTLGLSDVIFVSDIVKDSTGNKIVPNVAATVTNKTTSLTFYFEVYSNKVQDVNFEYSLNDINKNTSFKQNDHHSIKSGSNTIIHTINYASFAIGNYSLRVSLKDKDWKEVAVTEKKFLSKIYGVPSTIVDLDKAVDQLMYIASSEELDFIRDAKSYEEKLKRFLNYWDKKKPNQRSDENPILSEYYRRIDYANKNFKGFGEGWKSDMGMVYVTLGPPSYIDRHPFDADSKPYEIWQYYDLNQSYLFLDQTGFGDYRIYNADYSRWPGYRQ